ncbi:hypothetical protein HYDPIDRAFT_30287 [Hydnomerulius pinastri MD-312]|uniref:Aminoglycoside phosphotransferase domain-containing protein n=1 Tax=Hydnomerulius pinastri MD-312 TaxID=994086 RepID=A0A0C9VWZ1_9AGAM|nr:hypothetical protein HYDPIDRAFT_30287 [Hydnomerulius pinastri MD-312]
MFNLSLSAINLPYSYQPDEVSDVDTLRRPDRFYEFQLRLPEHLPYQYHSENPQATKLEVITPTSIVKVGGVNTVNEYRALALVRAHTSIPVLKVRRFFVQGSCSYIVMGCIKGERLDQCWGKMSKAQRFARRDLSRFRGHLDIPPFASYEALNEWFNDRLKDSKQWKKVRWVSPPFNHDGVPLVFTRHQDLGMQNIIIGEDGRVWLIDFGLAGFYPEYFDYADMMASADKNPSSWNELIPVMAGNHKERFKSFCRLWWAINLG